MTVHTTSQRIVTRDQVIAQVRRMFSDLDTNHDGYLDRTEIATLHERMMMGMHAAMARDPAGPAKEMADRSPRMGDRSITMDPDAIFNRLDTNHDGTISRQEFTAGHTKIQERRVVMKGDGAHRMGGPGFAARLFDMADANHDGRVSLQEAEATALAHFDRIDTNRDGRITPDERSRARAGMGQARRG